MLFNKKQDKCDKYQSVFADSVGSRPGAKSRWIYRHISACPRCRKRLERYNRLALAMSMIKTQPHSINLISQANSQALKHLKNSLSKTEEARVLQHSVVRPGIFQRWSRFSQALGHGAACMAILFLMKTGILSSMNKTQSQGRSAMKNYYKQRLGNDSAMLDEFFDIEV